MGDRERLAVLVVDDHPLFRLGLTMALRSLGFGRVDEALDGAHAVDLCRASRYDVVLLDLRMPRMNGIDAARAIGLSAAKEEGRASPILVMLTTFDELAIVREAERVGVAAFMSKETEPEALARTIDDLVSGRRSTVMPSTARLPQLSPREMDVLVGLADGQSVRAVADKLGISPETVKDHVANVYGKLGVRDRVSALREARRMGWLLLDEIAQDDRDRDADAAGD